MSPEDVQLVRNIGAKAAEENVDIIATLLECRWKRGSSPSLQHPLLDHTPTAHRLLSSLLPAMNYDDQDFSTKEFLEFVKSLLKVPSVYVTPWNTASTFIRYVHHNFDKGNSKDNDTRTLQLVPTIFLDIQCFLQKAASFWWEEERKRMATGFSRQRVIRPGQGEKLSHKTPRDCILEIISSAVDALWNIEFTDFNTNIFQLVSSIIFLCNDVEPALLHETLDYIYKNPNATQTTINKRQNILPLVRLAADVSSLLRSHDRIMLQETVETILNMEPIGVDYSDLPQLAESVFGIGDSKGSGFEKILYQILCSAAASTDTSIYSAVESIMFLNLAVLPFRTLHAWLSYIPTHPTTTESSNRWIEANTILLLMRASRQNGSQMVSTLVSQAFGGRDSKLASQNDTAFSVRCWKRLVVIPLRDVKSLSSRPISQNSKKKLDPEEIIKLLRKVFGSAVYLGDGKFTVENYSSEQSNDLNEFILLVFHSIFLGSAQTQDPHLPGANEVEERAGTWIHGACDVLQANWSVMEFIDVLFAVAVLLTVYCEIPGVRRLFVQRVEELTSSVSLTHGGSFADATEVYCLIFTIVAKSSFHDESLFPRSVICGLVRSKPSLEGFCNMAWSISMVPTACDILLENALELLNSQINIHRWQGDELLLRNGSNTSENHNYGTFALLAITKNKEWGIHEVKAWHLLSNVIVENHPPISFQDRAWLFSQIQEKIMDSSFTISVQRHLFRAFLARLLSFIGPKGSFQHERLVFADSDGRVQQVEDIAGVVEVLLLLLNVRAISTNGEQFLARCYCLLLDQIEGKNSNLRLNCDESKTRCDAPDAGSISSIDDTSECVAIFSCLGLAFRDSPVVLCSWNRGEASFQNQMQNYLCSHERHELQMVVQMDTLPTWLSDKSRDFGGSSLLGWSTLTRRSAAISVRLSLCEALIWQTLMLWNSVSRHASVVEPISKLTALFARRRHLLRFLNNRVETNHYESRRKARIFTKFCDYVVPVIKHLLSGDNEDTEMDRIASTVVDVCDMGSTSTEHYDSVALPLNRLLDLYTVLCDESSAKRLINYLEEKRSEGKITFCLRSIQSHDDIDGVIRHVRISIINVISSVTLWLLHLRDIRKLETNVISCFSRKDENNHIETLVSFVEVLSNDVSASLKGSSGCLTYGMFHAYVACISDCVKALRACLPDPFYDEQVVPVAQQSRSLLKSILCNYALEHAASFKKAMNYCVSDSPALVRHANRSKLLLRRVHHFCGNDPDRDNVASDFFEQLTSLFGKNVNEGEGRTPSAESVDSKNLFFATEGDTDDEIGRAEETFKESKIMKKAKCEVNAAPHGSAPTGKLFIHNEKIWRWSFSSILLAFERNWEESKQLIENPDLLFLSTTASTAYFDSRFPELLRIYHNMSEFLKQRKTSSDSGFNNSCLSILATHLPTVVQSKFCSVMDQINVTLKTSLHFLENQIKVNNGSSRLSMAGIESCCCLFAWLASHNDLSIGIQRWYEGEMKKPSSSAVKSAGKYNREVVLRKLEKLVFQTNEVESGLWNFYKGVTAEDGTVNDGDIQTFENFYDGLASKVSEFDSLRELVSTKLQFLRQERLRLKKKSGKDQMQRKKAFDNDTIKRVKKARRDKPIRSRNGVIDTWLDLDSQVTGLNEARNRESFAELEDFLAEG